MSCARACPLHREAGAWAKHEETDRVQVEHATELEQATHHDAQPAPSTAPAHT